MARTKPSHPSRLCVDTLRSAIWAVDGLISRLNSIDTDVKGMTCAVLPFRFTNTQRVREKDRLERIRKIGILMKMR